MFDLVKAPAETASANFDVERRYIATSKGLYASFFKRAIDILAILMALPIIMPIIGLCALLIRRDGGPAFYGQTRVGRGGREFTCWKLRSMVVDADARLEAYLAANPAARIEWDRDQKLRNDPRITKFGQFIRKSSIDELPQLLNVLMGDMSLVGPRPFMTNQKSLYEGNAYYTLRPGLTGLWQVSDRNESSFAERAIFDGRYASRLSLFTDVSILFRTVGTVIRGTGL